MGARCPMSNRQTQVSRDRAIEIAHREVTLKPDSVDAVRTTVEKRSVWRITFKGRLPDQPPGLFENGQRRHRRAHREGRRNCSTVTQREDSS